jgi:hypothetical protein
LATCQGRARLVSTAAGQGLPALYGGPGDDTGFVHVDHSQAEQEVEALHEEWRLADEVVSAVPLTHEIDLRGDAMSLRMTTST